MAEVISINQRDFEQQFKLIKECRPQKVLIVILDEDDQVQYIAPKDTSIYEICGWLDAVKQDILLS
jgi:hypothetical protein